MPIRSRVNRVMLAVLVGTGIALLSPVSGQDSKPEPPKGRPTDAVPPLPVGDEKPAPKLPTGPGLPGDAPKVPPSTLAPGAGAPATPPVTPKTPAGQPATINVQCPANASIWIEGQKMNSSGGIRAFQSPPLEPGKTFYYTFKVSWPGAPGQRDNVLEKEVTVRAGQTTVLDFRPQSTVETPIMPQPFSPGRPTFTRPGFGRPEGSSRR